MPSTPHLSPTLDVMRYVVLVLAVVGFVVALAG
jgi:hypothetical protein